MHASTAWHSLLLMEYAAIPACNSRISPFEGSRESLLGLLQMTHDTYLLTYRPPTALACLQMLDDSIQSAFLRWFLVQTAQRQMQEHSVRLLLEGLPTKFLVCKLRLGEAALLRGTQLVLATDTMTSGIPLEKKWPVASSIACKVRYAQICATKKEDWHPSLASNSNSEKLQSVIQRH